MTSHGDSRRAQTAPRIPAVLIAACSTLLSGCTQGTLMDSNDTLAEGTRRVEQLVTDAVTGIAPQADTRRYTNPDPLPCTDDGDTDRAGQPQYGVIILNNNADGPTLDDAAQWMTDAGYDPERDGARRDLQTETDGYTLRVLVDADGRLNVEATGPCLRA